MKKESWHMRRSASFAVALLAVAALFTVLATSAYATPDETQICSACHSGSGLAAPVVTLVSNNGTTATYSVTQVGSAWAAFDGATRIAGDTTSGGTFTGTAGDTFKVFSVSGSPGPISETDVTSTGGTGNFTVTPTAGANGSITPTTAQSVASGGSVTFTITANAGYSIADVKVNGTSVGAVSSYTFTNVTANETISATFAANPSFTITATAGAHGKISPVGPWTVTSGGTVTCLIVPDAGYKIGTLLADGAAVQAIFGDYYTFDNVTANHTLAVTFTSALQKSSVTIKLTGLKAGALKLGKKMTVKGAVKPARSGTATVTIQRKVGKKWVNVKTAARTINATSGAYSYTYKPTKTGSYRVKTSVAKTTLFGSAATLWKSFKVN